MGKLKGPTVRLPELRAEPLVGDHLLAVVVDQYGALVDLAERLKEGLADLVCKDRGEFVTTLEHRGGDPAHDLHPRPPIRGGPLAEEPARPLDGTLEVLHRGRGEASHEHPAVVRRVLLLPVLAAQDLSVDVERVLSSQLRRHALHRISERARLALAGGEGLVRDPWCRHRRGPPVVCVYVCLVHTARAYPRTVHPTRASACRPRSKLASHASDVQAASRSTAPWISP
jgi:hypothetical protein